MLKLENVKILQNFYIFPFHFKIEEKLKDLSKFWAQFLEEHSISVRKVLFSAFFRIPVASRLSHLKNGPPAISMTISVRCRKNHSNKWRYRARFWATGRLRQVACVYVTCSSYMLVAFCRCIGTFALEDPCNNEVRCPRARDNFWRQLRLAPWNGVKPSLCEVGRSLVADCRCVSFALSRRCLPNVSTW